MHIRPGNSGAQIVLFKDKNLVLYNPHTRSIGARQAANEPRSVEPVRRTTCPLCGSAVNSKSISFEAQYYFKLLQEYVKHSGPHPSPSDAPSQGNPFIRPANVADDEEGTTKNIPPELLVTGYYRRFFEEVKYLGAGSYGQVFLCRHMLDDLCLGDYAVKKVPVGDDKAWLSKVLKEVRMRERLHHPNIVDYKHAWLEMHRSNPMCPWVPWLFILMEYCDGGDMETVLWGRGEQAPRLLSEAEIWKIFSDIVHGLDHLHQAGVLHRDLKPSNILLKYSNGQLGAPNCHALLADFGTAEELICRDRADRLGYTGTVEYTAPELLETDEMGEYRRDYDAKSDMWSLGIILHALAFGFVPYRGSQPADVRLEVLAAPPLRFGSGCSRSTTMLHVVEALLSRDPTLRPSTEDLINHPALRHVLSSNEISRGGAELFHNLTQSTAPLHSSGRSAKRRSSPVVPSLPPARVRTCSEGAPSFSDQMLPAENFPRSRSERDRYGF
eukprot:Polyplicarium_translucidae@DN2159_c0_g1_i1.p1